MAPDKFFVSLEKAPTGRLFYYQILGAVALLLVLISWLNPNHYAPWVVFENEAAAFAGVFVAALALIVRGRKVELAPTYIGWLFFTLLVVLAQYGMGMVSWQFLGIGVLYLATLALSVIVGYSLHQDVEAGAEQLEKMVLAVVLLATIVSSAVVLGQWFQIENYYPLLMSQHGGLRPYGNLGQPNNQGTLLVTGVLCVELLLRKNAVRLPAAFASMLILIPAIAATGSRTAIVSAILASAYLLVVGRGNKWGFTLGWLFALLVCFVVLPKLGAAGATDSARLNTVLADSPRLHIYSQLMWAIFDKPWIGYGWMQTAFAQSLAAVHVFGGVETDYAHNVVIDFLVWFGIPLGALLLLSFGFAVVNNWRRSKVRYKIAYALLVPFVVHSLLEFPFAYAFFLLPVGVLLGYLGSQVVENNDGVTSPIRMDRKVVAPLFVLTTVLATVVCIDYLELAEDFRVLRFENKNIGTVPEGFQQSSPVVLTDMRFMMDMIRYKPRRAESSEKVERLRHYFLHAHYPGAHIKLISLEILDQNFENAVLEIHRFRNLYGEGIVSWGANTLNAAFCEDPAAQQSNQQVCCALSKNSQCDPDPKLKNELTRAH